MCINNLKKHIALILKSQFLLLLLFLIPKEFYKKLLTIMNNSNSLKKNLTFTKTRKCVGSMFYYRYRTIHVINN